MVNEFYQGLPSNYANYKDVVFLSTNPTEKGFIVSRIQTKNPE